MDSWFGSIFCISFFWILGPSSIRFWLLLGSFYEVVVLRIWWKEAMAGISMISRPILWDLSSWDKPFTLWWTSTRFILGETFGHKFRFGLVVSKVVGHREVPHQGGVLSPSRPEESHQHRDLKVFKPMDKGISMMPGKDVKFGCVLNLFERIIIGMVWYDNISRSTLL